MTLSELIINEVTNFIKTEIPRELGIKPDTQVNANDVIAKIEYLPFVDLSQINDVRYKIDAYKDDNIEKKYPEIAKTLRDLNKKGYVANAMWDTFISADDTYELDDSEDADSNFD